MYHSEKRSQAHPYLTDMMGPSTHRPPESYLGETSPAMDVFQFGLLLNEMFTRVKIEQGLIAKKSEFFRVTIEQCTEREPEKRPTSQTLYLRLKKYNKLFWEGLEEVAGVSMGEYMNKDTEEKNEIFKKVYERVIKD